ncbi:MAG: hypothetical protein FJZ96_01330 [Chloroflexi bacterium]|nr:hypothetical protein [Chloroflexota bacterium]
MFEQGDNVNLESPAAPGEAGPENSNRTFIIVAGIFAGLVFLTLVCLAVYVLVIAPSQGGRKAAEAATVAAQNTQVSQAMTQTVEASLWTPTEPLASPTIEGLATETPVVALDGDTATPETDPLTATMAALNTQVAIALLTPTATLSATLVALPVGGFADEVGLPGLLIIALALALVILLARKLRSAPAR